MRLNKCLTIGQLKEIQDVFNDITTGLNSRSAQV